MKIILDSADPNMRLTGWLEGVAGDPDEVVGIRFGESTKVNKGELLRAIVAMCSPGELQHYAGLGAYLGDVSADDQS